MEDGKEEFQEEMTRKTMFEEAYKILKEKRIEKEFDSEINGISYKVQGNSGSYASRIYLKVATWFQQCGCKVGVSNRPWGLCKHSIAALISRFLEINNLEMKEKKQIKIVDTENIKEIKKIKKRFENENNRKPKSGSNNRTSKRA